MTTLGVTTYGIKSTSTPLKCEDITNSLSSLITSMPCNETGICSNVISCTSSPATSVTSINSEEIGLALSDKDEEIDLGGVEDDRDLQSLFPLSQRPWSESPPLDGLGSVCPATAIATLPSTGLVAEAECIVNVTEAAKEVCITEKRLARCHVKESALRVQLYNIQASMAARLIQISQTQVGRARADRARHVSSALHS